MAGKNTVKQRIVTPAKLPSAVKVAGKRTAKLPSTQKIHKPTIAKHEAPKVQICMDSPKVQVATGENGKPVFIYALVDPRTGERAYIGKTVNPKHRFEQHLRGRTDHAITPKSAWIKSLMASGMRPSMEIIEECTDLDWDERERFHISQHLESGLKLKNLAPGGMQPTQTVEQRRKNARAMHDSVDSPVFALIRFLGKAKRRKLEDGNAEKADYFASVMDVVSKSTGETRNRFREYGKRFLKAA